MPRGATTQFNFTRDQRPGVPGSLVDVSRLDDVDVLINSDPQADEVWTLVIDTATNDATYGIDMTDPVAVDVEYLADSSATKAEIADGLAAAWNASGQARGIAQAVSDGVDTIVFTGVFPGVEFTLAEGDSPTLMTLTNTTSAAEADTVPFGRAMVSTSYQADTPDQLGVIAKSTALTAQVDTWTLTYDAGIEVSITIEVDGERYTTVPFAMATNLATVTAALDAAVDAAMPANTVIATNTATTVVLTSELAGKAFKSSLQLGVGGTQAQTKVSNSSTPATDFNRVFAGVSTWTYDEQQLAIATESAEYAANAGVNVLKRGKVMVENTETITTGSDVYVELDGTGDDAGKFFAASSSTRVLVDSDLLRWLRSDASSSDANVAMLSVHLAA